MKINKCLITGLLILTSYFYSEAQEQKAAWLPTIHGTVRAKYEYETDINKGRFQVRNCRISADGNVTDIIKYKAEIDLSDEGSIKMLDAYIRATLHKTLNFTIGQMRVPFTIDAHRSPHLQYFANRSFIAKQVGNVRDVGACLSWKPATSIPITIEAGLFNGSGITQQKTWHENINYNAKLQTTFFKMWNVTLSTQKTKPGDYGINMYDVGTFIDIKNLHVEAEYIRKCYSKNSFDDVNAFNSFFRYSVPMKKAMALKNISFLCRYDCMDDHSNGVSDSSGNLYITDYARNRVTGGVTFSFSKPCTSDIRLNYEHYNYNSNVTPKESEQSKFVIEFMIRF